jgi:type II secretory pathway component PulM
MAIGIALFALIWTPSWEKRDHREGAKSSAEGEVAEFRNRLKEIRNIVDEIDSDFLKPWKINQNISVSMQDNGVGASCMRVKKYASISLHLITVS